MTTVSNATDTEALAPRPERPRPRRAYRLHHLMLLVLVCAVALWGVLVALRILGPLILVLIALGLCVLGVAAVIILFRGQAAQRDGLVWALSVAAERGMPLQAALEAFAEHSDLFFRNRVLTLADALKSGLSLPDALDRVPGVLSREASVIIRVGWDAGIPADALAEAASRRSAPPPQWVRMTGRLAYLLGVLIALQVLLGFIMYFISPRFEAIFRDFGLALPPATVMVIQGTYFAVKYGYIALALFALQLALLAILPFANSGWLGGWVPMVDRLFLRRHTALILRSLARVVESGKPLPRAVATMARRYPSAWVRDRLRGVALDIDRGTDWCASLHLHGLINGTDAALLDAARRAENLPWALREVADSGERRLAYRLQILVQALFPIMVVALGFLVFLVATGYFAPLITLVERLAG